MSLITSPEPKTPRARRSQYETKRLILELANEMHELSEEEIYEALGEFQGYPELLVGEMITTFIRYRSLICKSQG